MEQAGLVLDNIFNPKNNSWVNGKNMVIPKGTKSFQNERGFTFSCDLPYPCIGKIATPDETVVFLSNNAISEIGIVKNNIYTPILREPLLNFNLNFAIIGTYTYNHLGQLVVAWIDDNNSPKILNINKLPFKSLLTSDLSLVNKEEFTLLEIFPKISSTSIEITNIVSGGTLLSGTYYVICSYGYEDGSTTSWFGLSNPISIYSGNNNAPFSDIVGSAGGIITDKAINIKILDIDNNFSYVNIAIISNINNIVSAVVFPPTAIINNTVPFNISSLVNSSPINITELLVNNPVYEKINSITNHNGELVCGNLIGIPELDIQTYVNKISINWYNEQFVSLNTYKGSYKDPVYISKFKGFRAGEVYGFLAAARLKRGGYYGIYHIPGRSAHPGDKTLLTADDYPNDVLLNTEVYKFQTRNTAGSSGTMGYWENRNEFYPKEFPVDKDNIPLANTPVRHHKFPTLSQLTDWGRHFIDTGTGEVLPDIFALSKYDQVDYLQQGLYNLYYDTVPTTSYGTFEPGGLTFTALINQKIKVNLTSVVFPDVTLPIEDAIVYVKASIKVYTTNNVLKTIIWEHEEQEYTYSSVNINTIKYINLEQGERLVITYQYDYTNSAAVDINFDANFNTFGIEGTLFSYPLGITVFGITFPEEIRKYIDAIEIFYYERTPENMTVLDQSILYPNDWTSSTNITDKVRFHGFDIQTILTSVKATHISGELLYNKTQELDVTKSMNYIHTPTIPTAAKENTFNSIIRTIKDTFIFPADNVGTNPSNYSKENCLFGTLNTGIALGANVRLLANLCAYKTDVYNSMFTQRVVSTGNIIKLSPENINLPTIMFGGDTFISPYGFMIWTSPNPSDSTILPGDYIRMKVLLPVESTANIGLRYEGLLPHEKIFPKTNIALPSHFVDGNIFQYGNFLGYNADYNALHNLRSFVINNPTTVFNNLFKHRIIRSLPQAKESTSLKWRIFPATLYYDMPMNKGEITGLVSQGQMLLILHKYATYRAMIKDLLQLFNTNAYLAEGDMFDRPPTEVYPTNEGYIGYQSKYATVTTEFGVVVVDRIRGKVFLIAEDVKELTTPDVEEAIKEYLNFNSDINIVYPITANNEEYLGSGSDKGLIYSNPTLSTDILEGIDNPINGKGVIVNYDKLYRRALLSITNFNRIYNETNTDLGVSKHGYLKFSVISTPTPDDIGSVITITFGGVLFTWQCDTVTGTNKFVYLTDRIAFAADIQRAIEATLATAGLSSQYFVTRQQSDIIITSVIKSPSNLITDFSSDALSIKLAENIPYYVEQDKSITLSISLQSMFWLFKHDYVPVLGYNDVTSTKLIQNLQHSSKVFIMNAKDKYSKYFTETIYQSFIDIPVNLKETPNNVFVDNIVVLTTVRDIVANHNFADKAITHYAIYTQNQCTGLIPIITLGYINDNSTAHFDDRNLIIFQFRDIVIDHNEPFIDKEGNFLPMNLAGSIVTSVLPNRQYIISNITNSYFDYAGYDGLRYLHNNQIITTNDNATTIELFGNIILQTYKSWENYSYIADKLIVVRLVYDNTEQHLFELNNVFVNNNKK